MDRFRATASDPPSRRGTNVRDRDVSQTARSFVGPKMPAAFSMLSRRPQRPAPLHEPNVETLDPAPMADARPVHRRASSRSCGNVGIAFSTPAEAKKLQELHLSDGHKAQEDDELEEVLNLYHEEDSGVSEPEDGEFDGGSSFPSSLGGSLSTPRTAARRSPVDVTPQSNVSDRRTSPDDCRSPEVPLAPATEAPPRDPRARRDRYGFRCGTQHVDLERYMQWSAEYEKTIARRRKKWDVLLSEAGLAPADGVPVHFPSRSAKLQRYIRKGIPPEYRGQAWFFYANGPRKLRENPGLYAKLSAQAAILEDTNTELIERDLHRTFPDNDRYKPDGYTKPLQTSISNKDTDTSEPPLIKSLRRVLQTFALYRPKVGYCQSLNFIAGLFLLFLDEEKSFWMLVIITTVYLPNVHDANLEGANVDQAVLMLSIKESLPAVWAKMGGSIDGSPTSSTPTVNEIVTRLPPITLVTAAWFMSAFTGVLPIETTLRVWDCFFYEGSKIMFRIALTILKLGEVKIAAAQEFIEIFQIVQSLPRDLLDPGILMEACFKRRNGFGHLSQKDIDTRREKVAKMRLKSMKSRVSRDDMRVELGKPSPMRGLFTK